MRAPLLWDGLLFGLVSWLFVLVNGALWQQGGVSRLPDNVRSLPLAPVGAPLCMP